MSAAALTGRIGPNAITRVAEALPPRVGSAVTWDLFDRAGLLRHLLQPPEQMVDEAEVRALHGAVREALGDAKAREVARAAGRGTADYLLARRIPQPVQWLLKRMPAALAARMLLAAIRKNAWTFVGSGAFSAESGGRGRPVLLHIRGNPLCRGLSSDAPACDFYAATFERLFQVLVQRASQVREVACEACGDAECRFEIRWAA
jgi:divinyl protochlorophyllide a 8-vinyl-reductase